MTFEKEINSFEEKLKALKEKYGIPGLSVAITQENKIIYSAGFGYADIENKVKATPTTPYRIASLTKTITSTIILQLVEKGLMDLDMSIAEYIPNYLSFCEKNKKNLEEPYEHDGKMIDLSHLIKNYHFENQNITIRHHLQQTIDGEPGETYRYNGLLFGFLGIAIDYNFEEKFKGLQRNLIDKIGMTDSLPCQEDISKPEVLKRLAKPYVLDKNKKLLLGKYPQKHGSSAAGIISTVLDLVKFDTALNNNELISVESKEKAFTIPKTKNGRELPYALGWFVQREQHTNTKLMWHYGLWDNSFSSLYVKLPEKDLTLIILANSDGLSKNFNLHEGNLYKSPFAKAFLTNF